MGVRGQSYKCAQEKALRTKARRPSALTKCFGVTHRVAIEFNTGSVHACSGRNNTPSKVAG